MKPTKIRKATKETALTTASGQFMHSAKTKDGSMARPSLTAEEIDPDHGTEDEEAGEQAGNDR
jgi:hypothetical protein